MFAALTRRPAFFQRRGPPPRPEVFVEVALDIGAPRRDLEQFAGDYLERNGPGSRPGLIAALCSRIAARERALGGGANDLFAWGDSLWRDEAERVVHRLEARRQMADTTGVRHPSADGA
jgi:hypothetical protein